MSGVHSALNGYELVLMRQSEMPYEGVKTFERDDSGEHLVRWFEIKC